MREPLSTVRLATADGCRQRMGRFAGRPRHLTSHHDVGDPSRSRAPSPVGDESNQPLPPYAGRLVCALADAGGARGTPWFPGTVWPHGGSPSRPGPGPGRVVVGMAPRRVLPPDHAPLAIPGQTGLTPILLCGRCGSGQVAPSRSSSSVGGKTCATRSSGVARAAPAGRNCCRWPPEICWLKPVGSFVLVGVHYPPPLRRPSSTDALL
jgi:hypothetical protein